MKSYFVLLLVFFASFISGIVVTHYQLFPYPYLQKIKHYFLPVIFIDQKQIDYYSRKVSHHQLLKDQQVDMLFVGDSLTNEATWSELFPERTVANFGINADTTAGVIARAEVIASVKTEHLFVMVGVNDIFQHKSVEEIERNYRKLINRFDTADKTIYLFSILYLGPTYQEYTDKITQLNRLISRLAADNSNIFFIDLNQYLAVGNQLNPAYTNDDLHLNGEGYMIWRQAIKNHLKKNF